MVRIVLKITFLTLRCPKSVTRRLPLCPIMALAHTYSQQLLNEPALDVRGRFVFLAFSCKFVYFARSVHRVLTHGKPFTLCLSYGFPKIAFSSSFRTTTTYFGLFVKNLSVQVTSTLTIVESMTHLT